MIRLGVFKTRDEHLISVVLGSDGESALDYAQTAWTEYVETFDYNLEEWAENFTDSDNAEAIEFGEDPVIISLNSDGIFTPIKPLSCTINISTKNFLSDLYTGEPQSIDVLVTDHTYNQDLFYGYMTPCIYSQDWKYRSEIELEFISPLSSLEYFPYLEDYTTASIRSLKYIIEKCLKKSGSYYKKYDFPHLYGKDGQALDWRFIAITYLNEYNFVEDDNEHTVKSCKEVLEEVCKFMGISLVEWMGNLYFIDYNGIASNSRYLEYTIDRVTPTYVTLQLANSINRDSFYDGCGNISYDDVYNKINCSCNTYEIDSETISPYKDLEAWSNENLDISEVAGKFNPMTQASVQREQNGIWEVYDQAYTQKSFIKYYKDGEQNKTYAYSLEGGQYILIDFITPPIFKDTQDYIMGMMCKAGAYKSSTSNILTNISLKDYILLTSHWSSSNPTYKIKLPTTDWYNAPYYEPYQIDNWNKFGSDDYRYPEHVLYTYKDTFKYVNSDNKSLYINFNGRYFDRQGKIYMMEEYSNSDDATVPPINFIWMQIKIGNYYLGGQFQMPKQNSTASVPLLYNYGIASTNSVDIVSDYFDHWEWVQGEVNSRFRAYWESNQKYNGKTLNLCTNVTWEKGTGKTGGLVFGLPAGISYGAPIEITFYKPHTLNQNYRCDCVFISNFECEIIESNLYSPIKSENDDDILYTNETTDLPLNPNIIQEYDDLELIINTQLEDRKSSYSSLLDSPTEFNKYVWDKAVGNLYNIQEYNLINKYYNHYKSPKLILTANLINRYYPYTKVKYTRLTNSNLYMDTCEYNVRDSSYNYTLIEF